MAEIHCSQSHGTKLEKLIFINQFRKFNDSWLKVERRETMREKGSAGIVHA